MKKTTLADLEGFIDDGKPVIKNKKDDKVSASIDRMREELLAEVQGQIQMAVDNVKQDVVEEQAPFQPSSTPTGDVRRFLGMCSCFCLITPGITEKVVLVMLVWQSGIWWAVLSPEMSTPIM